MRVIKRVALQRIALLLLVASLRSAVAARHHTRHTSGLTDSVAGLLSDGTALTELPYSGHLSKDLAIAGGQSGNDTLPPNLPTCRDFKNDGIFTGKWVDHPDPNFRGLYDQHSACPKWAPDYDCDWNSQPEDKNPELMASEYRKVFQPDECNLRPWDTQGFDKCMKGRRIIFVGDSMTWQMYTSLACLLAPVTDHGFGGTWEKSNTTVRGTYSGREWPDSRHIMMQYFAQVKLKNGGEILARCFGRFNGTLWDDVFAEIGPLTERDVIIVNFGAWYPRFNYHEIRTPFEAFKQDVREIFVDKLANSPAQTFWRVNSPSHFGGHTGTFTAIQEMLMPEGVPKRQHCDPVTVGEYWFRDHVVSVLKECGEPCNKIKLLPIFDLSLARHNSHHGTFGRGRDIGFTDCRHYCLNVIDWWNIILYSMMCF